MRPLFATVLLLASCEGTPPPPKEFDGAAAFRYVETQLAFGPRIPGSPGHTQMAAWLDSLLRTRADTVIAQRWTHVTRSGDSLPMVNLLARFNSAATHRVLYLAHWDTRPRADAAGSRDTMLPVPGANDGGSGVAILLGMADALKKLPPETGVDLLFVDGEDYGSFNAGEDQDVLIGSRYYAANLPAGERPRYAILFDMVGDRDLRIPREGNSVTGAPDVVEMVWAQAEQMGYGNIFVRADFGPTIDDHVPLQQAGIRAIDLIDFDYGPGNSFWHTGQDTVDKLSAHSFEVVGEVVLETMRRLEK